MTPLRAQVALPTIRLASGPSDLTTPFLYAIQAKIFEKYGLHVDLTRLSAAPSIAALSGGSIDIAASSALGLVTAVSKGLPLTTIGAIGSYDSGKPDVALLVATNSPIKTAKDLVGKTLASVSLQDMNTFATFTWLDQHGVDHTSLKYVEMPASATLAAIDAGTVAGSTVYEPFYSEDVATGKVRVVAYPYDSLGKHYANSLLFTSKQWAAEHPELVDKFLRATQEASAYVAAHERETAPLMARYNGTDPNAVVANTHHTIRGVPFKPADLQMFIDLAAKYKLIATPFRAQDMICSCAMLAR
jgi:NitT/TauT family transport system substrate-binding protein